MKSIFFLIFIFSTACQVQDLKKEKLQDRECTENCGDFGDGPELGEPTIKESCNELDHGQTKIVTKYEQSKVTLPTTCTQVNVTQVCNDGSIEETPINKFVSCEELPEADNSLTPVLIAHGNLGRVDISCDNGRSWSYDSWDKRGDQAVCGSSAPLRCGETQCPIKQIDGSCRIEEKCDCSHGQGVARGVAFGDGKIMMNYSWGTFGQDVTIIQTSEDGVTWKNKYLSRAGFGTLSYGDGHFLLATRQNSLISDDGGETFSNGGQAAWSKNGTAIWTARQAGYIDNYSGSYSGGRHVVFANGDVLYTDDQGKNWTEPETSPSGCGSNSSLGSTAVGNGKIVVFEVSGRVCSSNDGGTNWTAVDLEGQIRSHGVYNTKTSKFHVWNTNNKMYSSSDGVTWSYEEYQTGVRLGVTAVAPNGDFVATNSTTNESFTAYEGQRYYHSSDGLNWTTLDKAKYTGGHPVHKMTRGFIKGDSICPK